MCYLWTCRTLLYNSYFLFLVFFSVFRWGVSFDRGRRDDTFCVCVYVYLCFFLVWRTGAHWFRITGRQSFGDRGGLLRGGTRVCSTCLGGIVGRNQQRIQRRLDAQFMSGEVKEWWKLAFRIARSERGQLCRGITEYIEEWVSTRFQRRYSRRWPVLE